MSAFTQSSTRKAYSAKKLLALSIHINAFDMASKNIEYTSCSINYFWRKQWKFFCRNTKGTISFPILWILSQATELLIV